MIEIIKITDSTYCFSTGYIAIPFYKLNEKDIVMIDSGLSSQEKELLSLIESEGLRVKAVILTHSHYDHSGNCAILQEKYGAEIIACSLDAALMENAECYALSLLFDSAFHLKKSLNFRYFKTDRIFDSDLREIEIEGKSFEIIPSPGHASRHSMIVTPDKVCCCGDLILSDNGIRLTKISYSENIMLHLEQLDMLQSTKYKYYIAAHTGIIDNIKESCKKNKAKLLEQANRIKDDLKEETCFMDLYKQLCRRYSSGYTKLQTRGLLTILKCNLEYLIDTGQVSCTIKDYDIYYKAVNKSEQQNEKIKGLN